LDDSEPRCLQCSVSRSTDEAVDGKESAVVGIRHDWFWTLASRIGHQFVLEQLYDLTVEQFSAATKHHDGCIDELY
jgi:hypothetical protein